MFPENIETEVDKMKKKPLIILLVILILVLAGGASYYILVVRNQTPEDQTPQYYTYELDDSFVTNVKDSQKLFKTTIVLVATDENLTDMLTANKYVIRDTILFMLRDLTEEDICSDTIQDKLRTEIPAALNKALGIDSIVSVYFGDFVMQ
jgi:flagellar basal body-associated protein FliL